jgi:putative ABC transport system permease protein
MILTMSWRNIWRNKMRSLVIILSVSVGLFAGIMILALYKGMMQSRIKTVIYAEAGHLQIHDTNFKKDYAPIFTIKEGAETAATLKKYPAIKALATRTITMGMLSTTTGSAGVQINGILSNEEQIVSQLDQKIIIGKGFNPKKRNEIFIGMKLAKKMKLNVGNKLVLTFTDTGSNMVAAAFRIAAIFESDNAPLDERNVYVSKKELNELLGIGDQFHEIAIILKKNELLAVTQEKMSRQFPDLLIENWKNISPETDLMVETVDITSYIIMCIILFALAFGIINTMLMAILERTKEMGMMMALGMNKFKMFMLVLLETFFLTIAGTPIGLAASWLVIHYYSLHGFNWERMGKEMMSSFGFGTTIYPAYPSEKITMTIAFVFITAIISCIYPAIKALQLNPVEALRK